MIGMRPDTWRSSIITSESTLREAIEAISSSGCLMACVINHESRLEGIVTDSDVRRLLLAGENLGSKIGNRLNANPVVADPRLSDEELAALCDQNGVREIPLCSPDGQLIEIFVLGLHEIAMEAAEELSVSGIIAAAAQIDNPMFIMAGGKGSRLRSVVSDRPKPLAHIGDRPILQTIIERAAKCGIRNFFVSVNHMGEMIEQHLKSASYAKLNIEVVRETEPLGTAGAIGFIANQVSMPMLVTNADLLTTVPYGSLLRFHELENSDLTCVVRRHQTVIPFGVVEIVGDRVQGIVEKPQIHHYVNAGIYVMSAAVCRQIEPNRRLDMPDLVQSLAKAGKRVTPFFLHEYWIDVGVPDDFHRAKREYRDHFGSET